MKIRIKLIQPWPIPPTKLYIFPFEIQKGLHQSSAMQAVFSVPSHVVQHFAVIPPPPPTLRLFHSFQEYNPTQQSPLDCDLMTPCAEKSPGAGTAERRVFAWGGRRRGGSRNLGHAHELPSSGHCLVSSLWTTWNERNPPGTHQLPDRQLGFLVKMTLKCCRSCIHAGLALPPALTIFQTNPQLMSCQTRSFLPCICSKDAD